MIAYSVLIVFIALVCDRNTALWCGDAKQSVSD